MHRLVTRRVFVVLAFSASLAVTAAGSATVPGKNGRIVFAATAGRFTQLFTVEPDGTGLKQVTHFGDSDALNVNWSPDGTRLVFERDFPAGHAGIYVMNADGGGLRSLTRNTKKGHFEVIPAYSPDGRKIVFGRGVCLTRNCNGPRDHGGLWIEKVDGAGARRITPRLPTGPHGDHFYDHAQFSPDGKRIVFVKRVGDDRAAVFVTSAHGGKAKRLTGLSMGVDNRVDWSPNGKLILFSDNYQGVDVFTIRPNGTGLKRIYRATDGNYSANSWSPDGKRIMLVRGARGTISVCVMNADGSGLRQITHGLNIRDDGGSWGTHP
jgi:Tol biopolymer transport system component